MSKGKKENWSNSVSQMSEVKSRVGRETDLFARNADLEANVVLVSVPASPYERFECFEETLPGVRRQLAVTLSESGACCETSCIPSICIGTCFDS